MDESKNLVKIGQAAKTLGVSIDTLRRWEKEDKITSIRTPGGTRLYSLSQLETIKYPAPVNLSHSPVTLSQAKGIYSSATPQNDKINQNNQAVSQPWQDLLLPTDLEKEASQIQSKPIFLYHIASKIALGMVALLVVATGAMASIKLLPNNSTHLSGALDSGLRQNDKFNQIQTDLGQVLAAVANPNKILQFNTDTNIKGNLTVNGDTVVTGKILGATNIVNTINGGSNVVVDSSNPTSPTISVSIPPNLTVNGIVGNTTLKAGNDISISSSSATLTLAGTSTLDTVTGRGASTSNALTLSGSNNITASSLTATGGSINGVSIGSSTVSTGAFSTLSASGATTLSVNGAASTPSLKLTGTIFTGGSSTTTKPQLLIEPGGTTSTGWSTSGTGLGINLASGFSGNLIDAQINGSSKFSVDSAGNITISGSLTGPSGTSLGYWSRSGTTLSPTTAGDNVTTSGNISTTGSGTITSAGTLTASNGLTLSTGALSLTATSGAAALTLSSSTTAFNVNSGVFNIDTTNSRVGVGTTSPAGALHVAGQCVTGDTKLKRRRKRKNKDGEAEDDWEEIDIKDIKEGDEILTLNEKTGEFIPQKVNKLLDMGIQDVFELITQSKLKIKTTSNHPYLILKDVKLPKLPQYTIFEADPSIRIDDLSRDTFFAIANKQVFFVAKLTKEEKKILAKHYQKIGRPKLFGPEIYAQLIVQTIKKFNIKVTTLIIDQEYSSNYDKVIAEIIEDALPQITLHFGFVGKHSPAHLAANRVRLGILDKKVEGQARSNLNGFRAAELLHPGFAPEIRSPLSLLTKTNYTTEWVKVKYLKPGMRIATIFGWQKISNIIPRGRQQTYDIEVEGTHNFVGNNIVAHNTIIFGQGEAGTPTATTLRGAAGSGTNIAGANFTFDASNGTGTGGSGALVFRTAPTGSTGSVANTLAEIMRITPGGNVGIGTTSPDTKLGVFGKISFADSANVALHADNGSTDFLTYDSVGNVTLQPFSTRTLTLGNGGASPVVISSTSNSTIGTAAFNITDNSLTSGNAIWVSSTSLTTGNLVEFRPSYSGALNLTTGSALSINSANYVHTALNETGSLVNLSFADASTNANNGGVTNGLLISPTLNTSGAGTKTINGLQVAAPTDTACTTGACTYNGLKVTGGSIANITSTALAVDAGSGGGTNYAATFLNGNVGIGTTSPGSKLEVNGATTIDTGGLTVTAGGETITAGGLNVSASNISVGSAAQTTGNVIAFTANSGQSGLIPASSMAIGYDSAQLNFWDGVGAKGLRFYDTVNAVSRFSVSGAGAATIPNGLTISAGGETITSGNLTLSSGLLTQTGAGNNSFAGNVGIGTASPGGLLDISKAISGTPSLTGPYYSESASTFTDNATTISGTAANMAFNSIAAPTLAASNTGVTTTNAYTFYIAGAPTAGTNETITNKYALGVNGNVNINGTITTGTNSGQTLTLTPTSDTTALTLVGTNVLTQNLAYFNAKNQSGTIFNIAYGATQTLTGALIGESIDLNNGQITNSNNDVTGLSVKLPTVTDSNATGTVNIKGLSFGFGTGTGINQTGAGATIYTGVDVSLPALTQTSGSLTANGLKVTTSSQITTSGTANGVNISASGVGAGSLNGINISSITAGAGTENALNIGSGWDNLLSVNGTTTINGSGVSLIAGGGTGQSSYTSGDILYYDSSVSTTALQKLAGGVANNGKVLTVTSGLPTWGTIAGSSCTDCVVNDPTAAATDTITPSTNITSLVVRQTTALTPTADIFDVTNKDGTTKYFFVDSSGNVSTGGVASQTLTLTPTTNTTALTLVGTNVTTQPLEYINAKNSSTLSGIVNLAYGAAQTLTGAVTGIKQDLSTNLTATNQSVAGESITLPGVTNTNTTGTINYQGLVVSAGGGINQNGTGGTTVFSGADITIPALTQTLGTLTGNGIKITTPSSITTGGVANGLNISSSGVGAGSLNGINISGITAGAGTETAISLGGGWDTGISIANNTTNTASTINNISLGTLTGGASSTTLNQITTGTLTASATSSTDWQINLGNVAGTTTSTFGSIQTGSISGAGTTSYGINLGANTSTAATNYGINIGAISGAGTTNYGLYVGSVSGATNNYAAIFAGGNVGIGTSSPLRRLDLSTAAGGMTFGDDVTVSNERGIYWQTGAGATGYGIFRPSGAWTNPYVPLNIVWQTGVLIDPGASSSTQSYVQIPRGGINIGTAATPPVNGLLVAGNVGIGTTSPNALLDVLKTSGDLIRASYDTTNYAAFTESSTGATTLTLNGQGEALTISSGTTITSVGTTPGTAAPTALSVTGATGGNTTIATTGVGGIGGPLSLTGGVGGTANSATTADTGGKGGNLTFTTGVGGAAAATAGTKIAGAGGDFLLSGGVGGTASGAGTSNTGGAGGNLYLYGGTGGIASGATTNTAGSAGNVLLAINSAGTAIGNVGIGVTNPSAALSVGSGSLFQVSSAGLISTTPSSNSNALTITGSSITSANLVNLDSRNTSGTIYNEAFGASTTLAGALTGKLIDLNTNVTDAAQNVTGVNLKLPAVTAASTTSLTGFNLSTAGAFTTAAVAGTSTWTGLNLQMPNITQGAGSTLTSTGIKITGGTVTSGTSYALVTDSNAGNVGVGVSNPSESLSVNGRLALVATTTPTATASYGKVYTKSADNLLHFLAPGGTDYNLTASSSFFTNSNTAVANGGSLAVTHNQNTNDLTATAFVKEASTGLYYQVQANQGKPLQTSDTSLKAWWKLDEASGNAADTTGNASNSLTANGTLTYSQTGKVNGGTAIKTNGTTGYLSCTDATCGGTTDLDYSGTGGFTVGAWYKKGVGTATSEVIMSKWNGAGNQRGWELDMSDNILAPVFYVSGDGVAQSKVQANNIYFIQDTDWHFIVGRYDGNDIGIYIDGRLVNLIAYSAGIFNNTAPFNIFAENGVVSASANSMADDVFVYQGTLSDEAIWDLYQFGTRKYKIEQTSANTVTLYNFSGATQDLRLAISTNSANGNSIPLSNITAAAGANTIANGSNAQTWNWGTLTTQTGMTFGGGTAMTTGSVFALGSGTYVHTALNDTGSLTTLSFTDASTNANNGGVTNGLLISPTLNTSGAGTKTINGINIAAPTDTACTTGACTYNGLKITGGSIANITSTALTVDAGSGAGINYAATFSNGNVGIGTTAPSNTLQVIGSICAKSTNVACAANVAGTLYATNTTVQAADVAENYISSQTLEPGDIVTPSGDGNNQAVIKTSGDYQALVIGIVSTKPGVTLNSDATTDSIHPNLYPVALNGRVPTKVSTENGPIAVGNYLTSSSTPGVAMKATYPGPTVGKALESYDNSDPKAVGKIMAFLNVSYADPGNVLANISLDDSGNIIMPKVKTDHLELSGVNNVTLQAISHPELDSGSIPSNNLRTLDTQVGTPVASDSAKPVFNNLSDTINTILNAQINTQTTVASNSAQIAGISTTVASQSAAIASTSAQLAVQSDLLSSLTQKINDLIVGSSPSAQLNLTSPQTLIASDSAKLADLSTTNLQVSQTLKSLGESFLGKTIVAGDFSVDGTLSLTGSSLNALPTLFIQNSALTQLVDFFNGKITINNEGKLTTKEVETETLTLKGDKSAGEATLTTGQTELAVFNSLVDSNSLVIITPETATNQTLAVTDRVAGEGFVVKVPTPTLADIKFSYLIIRRR